MLLKRDRALMAVDIVLDVAFHAGRTADATGAADIAERLGAQRRGIEPVLQALTRAGLLDSTRGPRGGYRLARAPRAIPLIEAVDAVLDAEEASLPVGALLCWTLTASIQDPASRLVVAPAVVLAYALSMLVGLTATGCYQRDARDTPLELVLRIVLGLCGGLLLFLPLQLWLPRSQAFASAVQQS